MKVALYCRVSLDESNRESKQFQDLENQSKPLRDFCKALNYEIVKEYSDKMSGANPARPGFRDMINDAMLRRFSGIVVWKLDRFSSRCQHFVCGTGEKRSYSPSALQK